MNWYKKSQLTMTQTDWNRFDKHPGVTWKMIYHGFVGDATEEEKQKIEELGLLERIPDPKGGGGGLTDQTVNPNDERVFPDLHRKEVDSFRNKEYRASKKKNDLEK